MNKYIGLIIIFVFSFSTIAFGNISLFYDGEEVNFEHEPVVVEERVFYPMRELVELFEGEISWEQSTQTAITKVGDNTVKFTLNKSEYVVNDITMTMSDGTVPVVVNESIYLPIRYLAESLSFLVGWNYEMQAISVDSQQYYLNNINLADENDKYIIKFYLQYLNTASELLELIDNSETLEDKKFYTNTTLNYVNNINKPEPSSKIVVFENLFNQLTSDIINSCNNAIETGDYDQIDEIHADIQQIIDTSKTYNLFN